MLLWIPVTIAAAFLQNLRSAMQRAVKGRLSTAGASYARFLYALPLALIYFAALRFLGGFATPTTNPLFFLYCALGGLSQILFTVVLLRLFSFRSFAVGTAFSKLEVALIALLGSALLGDEVGVAGVVAIGAAALGTMALSLRDTRLTAAGLARGLGDASTLIGLVSAVLLGASVVFYRGAALALGEQDFLMRAGFTLVVALAMQTAMMGAWFIAFDRAGLHRVFNEWRRAAPVGAVGMACSVCWFTAFTLQNAAYVRALGQIELVFAFAAGIVFFGESVTRAEVVGVSLTVAAVLLLLLAA